MKLHKIVNNVLEKVRYRRLSKWRESQVKKFAFLEKRRYKETGKLISVETKSVHNSTNVLHLRKRTSDAAVFLQTFEEEQFNVIVKLANKHQIKVQTILDCGANIGTSTIYFKQHWPDARVIAIEPELNNANQFKQNILANKLKQVTLEQAAIWNQNEDLQLSNSACLDSWAFEVQRAVDQNSIKGITINALIEKHKIQEIDVLKIDIEGSEKHLFNNAEIAATFLTKTKLICLEVHEKHISSIKVQNVLEQNNFEVSTYSELTIGINRKYL